MAIYEWSISYAHTGRMLVQLLNPSPVSATINKNERIGSLYPLDGKVCSTKTLKLHKHNAEDIIEQMVTNAEGLMDEEKDKLRRLLSEYHVST